MASELYYCKADFLGCCILCGGRIYVGDDIYHGTSKGNMVAAHHQCCTDEPSKTMQTFDINPNTGQSA